MKITLAALLLLFSSQAMAVTAYFTGQARMVQTVSFQMGWSCQYQYATNYFYVTFIGQYCPSSVEIE